MPQSKSCEDCGQACRCKEAYAQPGCGDGPPVTREVLLAFMFPILVFVILLGIFGGLVTDVVDKRYQTPLAAGMALPATVALVLAVHRLKRQHREK